MARIVAVVMAIALLGTVSFAASYDSGLVKPGVEANEAEAQETVLVFATKTAKDQAYTVGDDKIIGIAQDTDVPEEIPVNAADLTGYDYITIAYGGSDGTVDYAYIDIRGNVGLTTVVAAREVEIDGVIYENVAYAKFKMTADGTITKYGIKFNSYDENGAVVAGAVEKDFSVTTTIVANGEIEFGAIVLGVPYEAYTDEEGNEVPAIKGTIKATPYVVYAQ